MEKNKKDNEKEEKLEIEIIHPEDHKYINNSIPDVISPMFITSGDITLKQIDYMCSKMQNNCENCILNKGSICGYALMVGNNPVDDLNDKIISWFIDNPPKSYLMEFKEKFPNAHLSELFKIPNMCVKDAFGDNLKDFYCECESSKDFSPTCQKCADCWRQEKKEELE